MATLKAPGFRIPEQVAMVGFDDDPMARVFGPSLITIHYPIYEMERACFARFEKIVALRKPRSTSGSRPASWCDAAQTLTAASTSTSTEPSERHRGRWRSGAPCPLHPRKAAPCRFGPIGKGQYLE
jgi:hypothetical protein